MKSEEKYRNVLSKLKESEPKLENPDELTNDIMRSIRKVPEASNMAERIIKFLFGWTQNQWIRLSMGTTSFIFLCIFVFQQFTIANRINSLEKQLSKTEKVQVGSRSGMGLSQRVILNFINKSQDEDSITLAKKDLEKLLNSYLELKQSYESLQESNQSLNLRNLTMPDQREGNSNNIKNL